MSFILPQTVFQQFIGNEQDKDDIFELFKKDLFFMKQLGCYSLILAIFFTCFFSNLNAEKIVKQSTIVQRATKHQPKQTRTEIIKESTVAEFIQNNSGAQAVQCTKDYSFNFKPYPLYQDKAAAYFPFQGNFSDMYIVTAAHAKVYSDSQLYLFINNTFITETLIKHLRPFKEKGFLGIDPSNYSDVTRSGTVAIISHLYPYCYGHFILDVLCQLALLELNNIEYDYLCTPYSLKFMQELLQIWGIDPLKIIPLCANMTIKADVIIMPTAVTQTQGCFLNANYTADFLINYVRNKLLTNAQKIEQPQNLPKKIFISRKDTVKRQVINEDEIFSLFQARGFVRYELAKLSIQEQILLFANADEIVGFVGSGNTNFIFSKPGTKYIEIVQKMVDATFAYLADICSVEYLYINDSTEQNLMYPQIWAAPAIFPITLVRNFLQQHPEI